MTKFPPPIPSAAINALGLELYRAAMAVAPDGHPDAQPGKWDRDWDLRTRYVLAARTMLNHIADKVLILPNPAVIDVEYGVWWHGEDRDGIRLAQAQYTSRESAVRQADKRVGEYGITGYRVVRREHHRYAIQNDYGLDVITTEWVDDPEPPAERVRP